MKIFESILPLKENHPFWNLAGTEPVLAFDIETTGFSPADSILYLIGLAKREGDKVRLIQLFGESLSDEAALLSRFFEMAKEADTLLHFNGEGFDIPYLRKCCRQYGMDFSLEKKKSIDIYKKIRPYKKLLPGDRLDQKSLEGLFSIPRKDTFSGGELIGVYEEYGKTKEEALLMTLLLHNYEDLIGLLSLCSLLSYEAFFSGEFVFLSQELKEAGEASLVLSYRSGTAIPLPFFRDFGGIGLYAGENCLRLTLPLFNGPAYHFFPDYKNYYYLPREDRAIHKSLGEFVAKTSRLPAKASTAYIKKDTMYLPVHGIMKESLFQKEYRSSQLLLPLEAWKPDSQGSRLLDGWLKHLKLKQR